MPKKEKLADARAAAREEHRSNRSRRAHMRLSLAGWSAPEAAALTAQLATAGLCLQRVAPDGNCLFRALADNMWGDAERHIELRAACVREMLVRSHHYSAFLLEEDLFDLDVDGWSGYVEKMALSGTWGGNSELLAVADALSREIVVHQAGERPWIVTPDAAAAAAAAPPLHVAYDGTHYDSVRRLGVMEGPSEHLRMEAKAVVTPAVSVPPEPSRAETAVLRSFPDGSVSLDAARAALAAALGDVEEAVEALACAAAGDGETTTKNEPELPSNGGKDDSESAADADARARRKARSAITSAAAVADSSSPASNKKKEGARNGPCPCGSSKVFKKCCIGKPSVAKISEGGGAAHFADKLSALHI